MNVNEIRSGAYEIEESDEVSGWTVAQVLMVACLVIIGLALAEDIYQWLAAANWPVKR